MNLVAIGAEAGVLAISHYVFNFTTLAQDNVASVLGIGVGTVVRYAGYKMFVFGGRGGRAQRRGLSRRRLTQRRGLSRRRLTQRRRRRGLTR